MYHNNSNSCKITFALTFVVSQMNVHWSQPLCANPGFGVFQDLWSEDNKNIFQQTSSLQYSVSS